MASGTAVVATRTEGALEIIEDGKTGVLVPIGDVEKLREAILGLLADGDLRASIRNGGSSRQQLTRFSLERMVEETETIYRRAMQEG